MFSTANFNVPSPRRAADGIHVCIRLAFFRLDTLKHIPDTPFSVTVDRDAGQIASTSDECVS